MNGCSAHSTATSAIPWFFGGAYTSGIFGVFVHYVCEGSTKSIERIASGGLPGNGFIEGHGDYMRWGGKIKGKERGIDDE